MRSCGRVTKRMLLHNVNSKYDILSWSRGTKLIWGKIGGQDIREPRRGFFSGIRKNRDARKNRRPEKKSGTGPVTSRVLCLVHDTNLLLEKQKKFKCYPELW